MYENNVILRTDRPTDLPFWKISNGRISATVHPIHFMFGSTCCFRYRWIAWCYFRLHQIQYGGWPPSWRISIGHISVTGRPIDFVFDPRVLFSGRRIEWTYFRLDQILDIGWPPSWKISSGHISGTGHPIHFVFHSRAGFSRSSDRMALFPVRPNPRSRPSAVLHNFEWSYLWNGSSGPIRIWF